MTVRRKEDFFKNTDPPTQTEEGEPLPKYSLEEIAKHNTVEDAWVAVHGKVFDVTYFMHDHPGGVNEIKDLMGRDATKEFDENVSNELFLYNNKLIFCDVSHIYAYDLDSKEVKTLAEYPEGKTYPRVHFDKGILSIDDIGMFL